MSGALLAALVVTLSLRAGALTRTGAGAAFVVGTIAASAGWDWAILLVTYFIATSALSRVGRHAKQARTGDVVAKGGTRDWRQVAANGGVFAAAAAWTTLLGGAVPAPVIALGVGALAAAAADSWATEIGTLAARPPRSILTLRPVPPGTSGGISVPGTIAMVGGAGFIGGVAMLLGFATSVATAAIAGGIVGAVVDSVLGATLQARRWCERCGVATEQPVHRCGARSVARGGVGWLDNDAVNLACTLAGGLMAALIAG